MKLSFLNDQIPEINSNRNNLQRRIYRHGGNHDKRYKYLYNKLKLKNQLFRYNLQRLLGK